MGTYPRLELRNRGDSTGKYFERPFWESVCDSFSGFKLFLGMLRGGRRMFFLFLLLS